MGTTALEVIIAIEKVVEGGAMGATAVVSYVATLIAQWHARSEQDIETLHSAALAAANAEAPPGAVPLEPDPVPAPAPAPVEPVVEPASAPVPEPAPVPPATSVDPSTPVV